MSDKTWLKWNLETFVGGVSSAVSPDLLPANQTAWGMNISVRGAKVETRPNIACRLILPSGLVQGAAYFSVQGGMIIVMIAGKPYRLRIGETDFSSELIPLGFWNSDIIKQVWMQQTVETLVIQDGQSNAILYNGSTASRADSTQVPRGKQMAYGNGRLWVAINANELVAGDIRTRTAGSELSFTETNYLSGGGSLWFQKPITGLAFIPVTGTSDYGTLLVFGRANCESVRADITQRDQWASYPGFVTNVLRSIGAASDWGLTEVNQDLFWRDGLGQLRSLRAAIQQESGPGNSSLSREVSRIVDFDSQQLLGWSSGIYFDNRYLVTASPFLNVQGGVSFANLVSLDFAPISTMQGRSPPAYNGAWQGVNWTQLVSGEFNGKIRGFGISSDEDGINRLWEFETNSVNDITLSCGSGQVETEIPIEAFVEYPRIDFNDPKRWKRLTRLDVWLSNIVGEITLTAYWRSDNNQKWTQWDDSVEECATMTDPPTTTPHVWKNILPQQRPLIKSFSIPEDIDPQSRFALAQGFGFQVRLVWTGFFRIERAVVSAQPLIDDMDYADRTGQEPDCTQNDVTGNEIVYKIPISSGCPEIELSQGSGLGSEIPYGSDHAVPDTFVGTPEDVVFTITNSGGGPLTLGTVTLTGQAEFVLISQPDKLLLFPGESADFVIRFLALVEGTYTGGIVTVPNDSLDFPNFVFDISGTVTGAIVTGYTYRGTLRWYGFLPYDYTAADAAAGIVPDRFLKKSANGTSVKLESLTGRPPTASVDGSASTNFGGEENIDPISGVQTGSLFSTVFLTGTLCQGSAYAYLGNSVLQLGASTTGPADVLVGDACFVTNSGIITRVLRGWDGGELPGPGYRITYCGAGMNGVNGNRLQESLTVQSTVLQAATAGGAGVIATTYDSSLSAYDPATGIVAGRVTQIHIAYPIINPSGFYLVQINLTQTPNAGGPSVDVTKYISVSAGMGGSLSLDYVIPQQVGYTFALVSLHVSLFSEESDDFDAQTLTWIAGGSIGYVLQTSWMQIPFFGMLATFTMCGTDWEDVIPSATGVPISTDTSGFYWPTTGTFIATDNTQTQDDFENYAVGTLLALTLGAGFVTTGRFLIVDYAITSDDFESYATGVITTLNFQTGNLPFNCWLADGTFGVFENLLASDDFETYSTGTITALTFGTGGSPANCWSANGSFG